MKAGTKSCSTFCHIHQLARAKMSRSIVRGISTTNANQLIT
jgi:predicted phosphohydrolase